MAPQEIILEFQRFELSAREALDDMKKTLSTPDWPNKTIREVDMSSISQAHAQFEEYVRNYKEVTEDDTN